MKVLILGAGVIGITSAWYLSKKGFDVTVIDRQNGPGLETSFANGGQISVSQTEPWANPQALSKIIKWVGKEDAPLLFRLNFDLSQWIWGMRFLFECMPLRTVKNTKTILELGIFSRKKLKELRRETEIKYRDLQKGIIALHTNDTEYEAALERAEMMKTLGLNIKSCSVDDILKLEPALKQTTLKIIGGTYAKDDESGDANLFCKKLTKLCEKNNVKFLFNTIIEKINIKNELVTNVELRISEKKERLQADSYVVALGSYSPLILKKIGINIPIYPVKGYSITIPLMNKVNLPEICLTDENYKLAISRLGNDLRCAGTAELNGYDLSINKKRCESIFKRVQMIFPHLTEKFSDTKLWSGLRPTVPNGIPIIGRSRFGNLFLNCGQGTLGWTLSCGSSSLLSNIISEEKNDVDFPFIS